jgi:hypothetical protein
MPDTILAGLFDHRQRLAVNDADFEGEYIETFDAAEPSCRYRRRQSGIAARRRLCRALACCPNRHSCTETLFTDSG